MVRTRRTTRSVSRGTTRKFVWVRNSLAFNQVGDANGTDLLEEFETAYGAQLIGCTVVRMRGYLYAAATEGVAQTADQFRFAARVVGGTTPDLSVPDPGFGPYGDPNADWMLWEPFATVNSPRVTDPASPLVARMIDVKSSRKLEELGERLVMFYSGDPAAPLISWNIGWDLSIGVKLP